MSFDDRKATIGGSQEAEKYLQVIAHHLAHAMNDAKSRATLHAVVPKSGEGAIHISRLVTEYPHLLTAVSGDFKNSVSSKAITGTLSQIIQNTGTNGEAILKATKALFELEVRLVTPEGGGWDSSKKIPVFYTPISDETIMQGADASLQTITFPMPEDKQTAPYPFLLINFDEDLMVVYKGISSTPHVHEYEYENVWTSILNSMSFTSPAYAHYSSTNNPHLSCYHQQILQPVKRILIWETGEKFGDAPELYMKIYWNGPNAPRRFYASLPEVNETGEYYYNYDHLRTRHGTCLAGVLKSVELWDMDYFTDDDLIVRWNQPQIPFDGITPNQVDLGGSAATLRIRRTDEDVEG